MGKTLENLQDVRHPNPNNRQDWLDAREYIKAQFRTAGLEAKEDCFTTTISYGGYNSSHEEEGCNIWGQVEGESDRNRIIVGARYDTSRNQRDNEPLRRNGAGVATLLQVARSYTHTINWRFHKPKYTTVFVAFDLNTLQESTRQSSKPGSQFYVDEFVTPKLQNSAPRGVYILDSLSSLNQEAGSQSLPSDFDVVFPQGYQQITEMHERKGNFLAAVTTPLGQDILTAFTKNFKEADNYRLQSLITSDFGESKTYQMFEEFDAHAFWMTNKVPTVLLTDTTADYRRLAHKCTEDCSLEEFTTEARLDFLYSTYVGLTKALLTQQTKIDTSGGTVVSTNWVVLVLAAVLTSVFYTRQ